MVDDDGEASFKRPGAVPFHWEIRPGIPKTRDPTPDDDVSTLLQPPKKLTPLRLQQLSPSPPSSSPRPRAVSPFAPPPSFHKAKPPAASGPPSPYWRSTSPRAKPDSSRWRHLKSMMGMKKSKSRDVKKDGEETESDDVYDSGTMFSPSEDSSRGSVSTSWSSPQSSSSSSSSMKRDESDLSSSEKKAILMMATARFS